MGEQIPFNELPRKEKIKRISQDVIDQIRIGQFEPRKMHFVTILGSNKFSDFNDSNCFCCALGASLLAKCRLLQLKRFILPAIGVREEMEKIFGTKRTDLIESAFEGWVEDGCANDDGSRCLKFFHRYTDPAERMEAIFQNILDNDGEFKP